MKKEVEFIDIDRITGKAHMAKGDKSIDVTSPDGTERCLTFKPATHDDLLSLLLSSSPMAEKRFFVPLAVEPQPSDSGNRRIRFLLNPKTAIHIEVEPSQVAALKAVLEGVAEQPKRKQ